MARRFKYARKCGCKTWAHDSDCKLRLGYANVVRRKDVNYCSARPRYPKQRRRAAKVSAHKRPKKGPKRGAKKRQTNKGH